MANLAPIPKVFVDYSKEEHGYCALASFLQDLHHVTQTGSHHYSWGLTIFRTVFTSESATTFPLAIKPNLSPLGIDLEAKDELSARLYNTVIEDAALDDASMETIEQAIGSWVEENGDLESGNPRYRFALVLHQAAIDETLQLPDPYEGISLDSYRASCRGLTRWELELSVVLGRAGFDLEYVDALARPERVRATSLND
ncbi:hypothetical protein PWT90_04209 [Aphanocladium album]|nr:hypothetical protein PWT90_04209 [Aphanocladium album]